MLPLPGNSTLAGYIHLTKDRPRRTERNALCSEYIIKDLPKGLSVVEHFGGAGFLGVMIEKLLQPSSHILFDIDEDCVAQLKYLFGDRAMYGNAKEMMGKIPADYIALDFPVFTAFREHEWNLGAVFATRPSYVSIADIANQRIGIHRELYTKMFGQGVHNNEDYVRALSNRWFKNYGYSVKKCAYHIFSFMLLTPEPPGEIDFRDVRK